MGSMGIIVRDNTYKQSNATALRFEKIYIGDKVELEAKNLEKLIFKNGKLSISEVLPLINSATRPSTLTYRMWRSPSP